MSSSINADNILCLAELDIVQNMGENPARTSRGVRDPRDGLHRYLRSSQGF